MGQGQQISAPHCSHHKHSSVTHTNVSSHYHPSRVIYPAEDTSTAQGDDPHGAISLCCPAHHQARKAETRAGYHELIGGEAAADPGGRLVLLTFSITATRVHIDSIFHHKSSSASCSMSKNRDKTGGFESLPWFKYFSSPSSTILSRETFKLMFLDTLGSFFKYLVLRCSPVARLLRMCSASLFVMLSHTLHYR